MGRERGSTGSFVGGQAEAKIYPGSGPSGGGKDPTSCLSVIDRGDYEVTGRLRRDVDLARALVVRVWLGPRSVPLPAFK